MNLYHLTFFNTNSLLVFNELNGTIYKYILNTMTYLFVPFNFLNTITYYLNEFVPFNFLNTITY